MICLFSFNVRVTTWQLFKRTFHSILHDLMFAIFMLYCTVCVVSMVCDVYLFRMLCCINVGVCCVVLLYSMSSKMEEQLCQILEVKLIYKSINQLIKYNV